MTYANLNTASLLKSDKTRLYQESDVITLDGVPGAVATGTDTYAATITGIEAYAEGQVFLIEFTNANTGSSTININSLGAKTLKKSVSTNLASGDIAAGQTLLIAYDGTNFQVIGLGGGGGSGTVNSGTQYRLAYYATTGTAVSEAGAITASRILKSDANGVPTHSTYSETDLDYIKNKISLQLFNSY